MHSKALIVLSAGQRAALVGVVRNAELLCPGHVLSGKVCRAASDGAESILAQFC